MSTYLCQSDEVWFSLILKICLSGAWFLSSKPMVCACFNVQCLSSISNRFASSLISSDVNAVPKSHMILEGMNECLKKLRQGLVLRCLRRLSKEVWRKGTSRRHQYLRECTCREKGASFPPDLLVRGLLGSFAETKVVVMEVSMQMLVLVLFASM